MSVSRSFIALVAGGVLLTAGLGKLLQSAGFSGSISLSDFPLIVAAIEIVLGLWLLSGFRLRAACMAACLLFAAFLGAQLAGAASITTTSSPESPCGCFGDPERSYLQFLLTERRSFITAALTVFLGLVSINNTRSKSLPQT